MSSEQATFAALVARARAALADAAFEAAWDAGQRMSAAGATDLARSVVHGEARSD